MNARTILMALLLALCAASCGKGDKDAKKEESSGSPGYDVPLPPPDDEKKK